MKNNSLLQHTHQWSTTNIKIGEQKHKKKKIFHFHFWLSVQVFIRDVSPPPTPVQVFRFWSVSGCYLGWGPHKYKLDTSVESSAWCNHLSGCPWAQTLTCDKALLKWLFKHTHTWGWRTGFINKNSTTLLQTNKQGMDSHAYTRLIWFSSKTD